MSERSPRIQFDRVAIIGTGLMGGALGLAMRRRGLARRIVGVGRNAERLAKARSLGAVDAATTDLAEGVATADLVVCCTPVRHIIETMPALADALRPGTLVTDAGSTKASVVAAGQVLAERGATFIGSHPMAGSDRSGVDSARADLYDGATTFVTVEESTPKDRVADVCRLWQAVGARVVLIHPERHDRLVAAISHLPHLLAVAATRTVADFHEDENVLRWVIGNGFRDTTRVAQGSTDMWKDICATNLGAIIEALDAFGEHLAEMRAEIIGGNTDVVASILAEARDFRRRLNARGHSGD